MVKNIAASVKNRLLNQARRSDDDFNQLLERYARERFLYRLSQSELGKNYILKGASVFQVWQGIPHRVTKDIDLLGFGSNEPEKLKAGFEKILESDYQDGIKFGKIKTKILQPGQKYEGVRLNIEGKLGTAKLFLQVDVSFGHVVTPKARIQEVPSLLDLPNPKIRVYPAETVIAEKLEAMISQGRKNSRIKDYYDCLFLAKKFKFKGELLKQAIKATFTHRQTPLPPREIPFGLTDKFVSEQPSRNERWQNLVNQGDFAQNLSLTEALAEIREFLVPPLQAAAKDARFELYWSASEKWQQKSLYEIYSQGVNDLGLARSKQIALNALKDGVERERVVEMMKKYDSEYKKLAKLSGDKTAERTVVLGAEVEIMQSQMSQSEQQSQSAKVAKSRRKSL